MSQNGKDWKEISTELSKKDKARPASTFTVDTRPPTTASLVQNKTESHFVSQISSEEAIEFLNKKKTSEKVNISIEDAIKNISYNNKTKIDLKVSDEDEQKPRIFSKFWSMPNGLNSDKVWKTQREQRAESEIIARQRKHDDVEDEGILMKIKKRHKISH